jgi:SNF2 family DNA or RNA helicase
MAEPFLPRDYQQAAIERIVAEPHFALFLDPGLGKSAIILESFRRLKEQGKAKRMLVIAPLRVVLTTWPEEIARWSQFEHFTYQILHGRGWPKKIKDDVDITLINPEGLAFLRKIWKTLPDMLVVDESTRFKSPSSQRSKLLRSMLPVFSRRYILTGTPMPNSILDLWAQMLIVDRGEILGTHYKMYRATWCVPMPRSHWWEWVPRPDSAEKLQDLLAPKVFRADINQLTELPTLLEIPIVFDLPSHARTFYRNLRRQLTAEWEGEPITAMSAGVLANKLRQVANGAIYVDQMMQIHPGEKATRQQVDNRKYVRIHTSKATALQEVVEDLGGKSVLIAYTFRHDLPEMRALLGDLPALDGGASPKETARLVAAWRAGELGQLAIHPAAAGHGLNLQSGGHVLIWYGLPWDLEMYDQVVHRLYRQGQKERVQVYRLIARDTIDDRIATVLETKDRNQRALLDALRGEFT